MSSIRLKLGWVMADAVAAGVKEHGRWQSRRQNRRIVQGSADGL